MTIYLLATVRTNNVTDPDMVNKIGTVWQDAMSLIGKQSVVTYGVYHNYAGNYRDDYDLSIGTTVIETASNLLVPTSAEYQIFPVNLTGENPVYQTWQGIWQQEERGELSRAYGIDYEQYEVDGSVSIYISVK